MPIDPRIRQCEYVRPSGVRCGSPAMRGAPRCYYHLRPPKIDDFRLASIADPRDVNRAMTEIFNAVLANKLDHKRAKALLYALQVSRQG